MVTFTHYHPLKKQGLENCTTILTFKHHQLNSQEWLDLTRIHMLKHCISKLQKSPAKIVNINEKEDTIFVNQTSSIVQASSSDVNFLCTAPSTKQGEAKETISSATDITLNEIQTLTRNQKVNVQGHLTLGQNPNKEVIKRNGQKGYVIEDCVIEDRTACSSTIQLYFTLLFIQLDDLLTQLESGNTYSFQNLSVKNYSGMTLLDTTPTTTFQKVDLD